MIQQVWNASWVTAIPNYRSNDLVRSLERCLDLARP